MKSGDTSETANDSTTKVGTTRAKRRPSAKPSAAKPASGGHRNTASSTVELLDKLLDGKSKKAIAQDAGISVVYLNRVLRGQASPSIGVFIEICRAADLPLSAFDTPSVSREARVKQINRELRSLGLRPGDYPNLIEELAMRSSAGSKGAAGLFAAMIEGETPAGGVVIRREFIRIVARTGLGPRNGCDYDQVIELLIKHLAEKLQVTTEEKPKREINMALSYLTKAMAHLADHSVGKIDGSS